MTMLLADKIEGSATTSTTPVRHTVDVKFFDQLGHFDNPVEWQAWRQLFHESPESSHHHYPELIRHQLSEFAPTDSRPIAVVQGRSDRQIDKLGILMPYRIRFNEAIAGLAGPGSSIHGYRLAGGRILSRTAGSNEDVFEAAQHFTQSASAQFLLVEDVIQGSRMDDMIQNVRHTNWHCFVPCVESRWGIDVNEDRDNYWKSVSKNTRKKIKRYSRKLQDAEVIRVSEVDQIPDFIRDVLRVAERSWKTRENGRFVDEQELTGRLTHLASNGMLRAWLMLWNGQPIAFDITVGLNGYMEGMECAYDEELSDLSPGTVLLSRSIDDLFEMTDVDFYDFGHGDMSYKARLSTDCRSSYHAILMPPGSRSTALLAAIRMSRFAFNSTRTVAGRLGVKNSIKKLRGTIHRLSGLL